VRRGVIDELDRMPRPLGVLAQERKERFVVK
jgi:hypothetical protein